MFQNKYSACHFLYNSWGQTGWIYISYSVYSYFDFFSFFKIKIYAKVLLQLVYHIFILLNFLFNGLIFVIYLLLFFFLMKNIRWSHIGLSYGLIFCFYFFIIISFVFYLILCNFMHCQHYIIYFFLFIWELEFKVAFWVILFFLFLLQMFWVFSRHIGLVRVELLTTCHNYKIHVIKENKNIKKKYFF